MFFVVRFDSDTSNASRSEKDCETAKKKVIMKMIKRTNLVIKFLKFLIYNVNMIYWPRSRL